MGIRQRLLMTLVLLHTKMNENCKVWVLNIACLLLDDGLPPLQDVLDRIDWNREHISISTRD
jgi:hypothetical protein